MRTFRDTRGWVIQKGRYVDPEGRTYRRQYESEQEQGVADVCIRYGWGEVFLVEVKPKPKRQKLAPYGD